MGNRRHVLLIDRHPHHAFRLRRLREARRHANRPCIRPRIELHPIIRNSFMLHGYLRISVTTDGRRLRRTALQRRLLLHGIKKKKRILINFSPIQSLGRRKFAKPGGWKTHQLLI